MATHKVVLFYREGRSGWTETYYYESNGRDARGTGETIGRLLAQVRFPLCSDNVILDAIRTSDVNIKRAAFLDESQNTLTGVTGTTGARDVRGVSLLVRMTTADSRYRRYLWMRGLPDDFLRFSVAGRFILDGAVGPLFRDFANFLAGNSGVVASQIRAISKESGANVTRDITEIARHASGAALLTVPGSDINATKETVRIKGVTAMNPLVLLVNGIHKAIGPPALGLTSGQVLLTDVLLPDQTLSYTGGGTLTTRRLSNFPINHVDIVRSTIHATGRPTAEGRGRRRARA